MNLELRIYIFQKKWNYILKKWNYFPKCSHFITPHAFSVFSTDSEGSDRPVHENKIYFSEIATWFAEKCFRKMRNLKKKSRKNQKFQFYWDIFFWKTFFEKARERSCAANARRFRNRSEHSSTTRSSLPNRKKLIFHQKMTISWDFVPFCSAMFHRVPRCSVGTFFDFREKIDF